MEDQLTVIERIRKCHHPSLAEGNKQKLEVILHKLHKLLTVKSFNFVGTKCRGLMTLDVIVDT